MSCSPETPVTAREAGQGPKREERMKLPALAILARTLALAVTVQGAGRDALRQTQTIPLPLVEGRIDHFGIDTQGRRLFVAALGNDTVEVLDLRAGKWLTRISRLREPQGIFFVPASDKLFVANGDDGTCRIFDGSSYKLLKTLHLSSDADNVRYDARRNQVYVGYGEGALAVLDAASGQKIADIALRGHPESFRPEQSGDRIFVNVPTADHTVAVVDRAKRSVIATWSVDAEANFSMALDEPDHRLLVVTRKPARLIVLDTRSGQPVASQPTVGDADDAFYDAVRKRVYVSGGQGFIDVFEQHDPDLYRRIDKITTTAGARTSLFVPELNRFYLAVPHRAKQGAEIRVYEPQ